MVRLENGSYDEIVVHLEREVELNALTESDDLPMATMTSSTSKPKTLYLQWNTIRCRLHISQGKRSYGQKM